MWQEVAMAEPIFSLELDLEFAEKTQVSLEQLGPAKK